MNAPLGCRGGDKISQAHEGPGPTGPLVFDPALRGRALKVLLQAWKYRTQLRQRRADAFRLFHARESFRLSGPRICHQNAARSGLTPRRLPDFDRVTRDRKAVQTLFFPGTLLRLQVHARNGIVSEVLNDFDLALGKGFWQLD